MNRKNIKLLGIDLNKENIKFAKSRYKHKNLQFFHGDALKDLPKKTFDVIVLSNVLEHIKYRVKFLKGIMKQIKPKRLLIRVPMFERDWRVPLKKELGIDWRLDKTHHIEYTKETFMDELQKADLSPTMMEFRWGEIWSVVKPLSRTKRK